MTLLFIKKIDDINNIQNIYMVSGEQNYLSGMVIAGLDRNCRFLRQKINYIFSLCRYPDKKPYFMQSGLPVFPPFTDVPMQPPAGRSANQQQS